MVFHNFRKHTHKPEHMKMRHANSQAVEYKKAQVDFHIGNVVNFTSEKAKQ